MPIMDGLTLLQELQGEEGEMKSVVVSAYGDMGNIRRAMQLGAVDFVTKPINLGDLEMTVKKTLSMVQRMRQARDLEREKLQAEAASEAKGRLLAEVSHELRTPLDAIINCAELVMDELGDHGLNAVVDDVRKIRNAGRHLRTLIADLIDFSTIEAGRMALRPQVFDIRDVVAEATDLVARDAERAAQPPRKLHGLDEAGEMCGDVTRVRQCLVNLLGNAAKFTPRRHGAAECFAGGEQCGLGDQRHRHRDEPGAVVARSLSLTSRRMRASGGRMEGRVSGWPSPRISAP